MNNLNLWNPLNWGEIMIEGAHNKINMILTDIFKDIVLSSYWICECECGNKITVSSTSLMNKKT